MHVFAHARTLSVQCSRCGALASCLFASSLVHPDIAPRSMTIIHKKCIMFPFSNNGCILSRPCKLPQKKCRQPVSNPTRILNRHVDPPPIAPPNHPGRLCNAQCEPLVAMAYLSLSIERSSHGRIGRATRIGGSNRRLSSCATVDQSCFCALHTRTTLAESSVLRWITRSRGPATSA